jgi:glycosyltransferase involved in cell wall biosynthesis
MNDDDPVRVLYSFPHKLGAQRICYAAWQHVNGMANAGAQVTAHPGVLHRPLPSSVEVRPTLSRGRARIPYRLLGRTGACGLHDRIVARRLRDLADRIDIVHTFPLGASRTLETARELGIPTVLERCNAHTEYAYSVVRDECARLGVTMPKGHEHEYNEGYLRREEQEYALADYLFCPSEFVMGTFVERGFPKERLVRFQYGFAEENCYPPETPRRRDAGLTVLFAAGCAPRKGLHYALEAWLQSTAHRDGTFLVVGEFIPGYAERLAGMLSHPSVKVLGFRTDLADVMRSSDILVLPSIEEGSALVTYDARGCGCVLLVSDASGAICEHMENALVHRAGDVAALAEHLTAVNEDRGLLERLRASSLATASELTWSVAGRKMVDGYRTVLGRHASGDRNLGGESGAGRAAA